MACKVNVSSPRMSMTSKDKECEGHELEDTSTRVWEEAAQFLSTKSLIIACGIKVSLPFLSISTIG